MLALRDLALGEESIDHEFAAGAISVVLGRNRAGKSRLCRLIAGLEAPRQGRIVIDGADVTDVPPGARSVALVYQAFVNYPHLSVFDNIASPLRARRRRPRPRAAELRERVHDIARRLQIEPLLARLPGELSGGQQQRVALGRALAKGARVLLLDEPLVNLDYKLREALEFELRDMLHGSAMTVIYTTSDPRDAFNLGDEVLLLQDGCLLQSGPPLDVYEQPVSAAAADLMSDPGINRLPSAGGTAVVRPEHLTLEPPPVPAVSYELAVRSVETNGSETYLHGTVGDEPWVARLRGLHRVRAGETVTLHAPRDGVLQFAGAADG